MPLFRYTAARGFGMWPMWVFIRGQQDFQIVSRQQISTMANFVSTFFPDFAKIRHFAYFILPGPPFPRLSLTLPRLLLSRLLLSCFSFPLLSEPGRTTLPRFSILILLLFQGILPFFFSLYFACFDQLACFSRRWRNKLTFPFCQS